MRWRGDTNKLCALGLHTYACHIEVVVIVRTFVSHLTSRKLRMLHHREPTPTGRLAYVSFKARHHVEIKYHQYYNNTLVLSSDC